MSPIYCNECGRANGANARRCIWCGVPMLNGGTAGLIETTRVEIGYLDGIDRFEDAAPVRLIISAEGIEVAEIIPGTRSVKIPASSILEASCVDASTIKETPARPKGWWLIFRPSAFFSADKDASPVKTHDYILAIKYKDGDQTHTAVFHREDSVGLPVVEGLARIVTSLIRQNAGEKR